MAGIGGRPAYGQAADARQGYPSEGHREQAHGKDKKNEGTEANS